MSSRLNGTRADRPSMDSPVVILARHATPDWNRKDIRYDVPPGPPLVPAGEVEAQALGMFLRTTGVQSIVTSPLVRTMHTAQLAGRMANAVILMDEGVAEYRHEENDEAVFLRCNTVFERVWAQAQLGTPMAIVSHGGPVRVMLERLGIAQEQIWHYRRQFDHQNPLPPAGAWRVTRIDANWHADLVFAPQPFSPYMPTVIYA